MNRLVWSVILIAFIVMAVAGPYKMARQSSPAEPEAPGASPSAGPQVSMAGLTFSPAELTVSRGGEVLFDNDDLAPHTVTTDDNKTDSGTLNPGKSFVMVIEGPVEYHCEIHPSMTGKIVLAG